jgi:hypothetical protein
MYDLFLSCCGLSALLFLAAYAVRRAGRWRDAPAVTAQDLLADFRGLKPHLSEEESRRVATLVQLRLARLR